MRNCCIEGWFVPDVPVAPGTVEPDVPAVPVPPGGVVVDVGVVGVVGGVEGDAGEVSDVAADPTVPWISTREFDMLWSSAWFPPSSAYGIGVAAGVPRAAAGVLIRVNPAAVEMPGVPAAVGAAPGTRHPV